ncbi:hypothetical protein BN9982_850028 [Mycobacterium tuberculosis]|nr:hypothetical protein BN9982_850028 [Mycobacterium tuberculosis]
MQLLTVVIPRFEELRKEGQAGQSKMTQYTRYLAIAADTSSWAAATMPVVVAAAAASAAPSTEPRAARSVAADPNTSGIASTNDMCHLPPESAGQRPRHPR